MLTLLVLRQIGLTESLGPFGDVTHTHTPKWHMCALWMTQIAISSSIEQWNTAKILLPTGQWQTSIQPFSIHLTTSPLHSGPRGLVTPIPASCPVHHAATQEDKQPLALTHVENLEFPVRLSSMCLDRGRRMEYPPRRHRDNMHARKDPMTGDRTHNLPAERRRR